MGESFTLTWPDRDSLPDAARAALMGPGAPFEMVNELVLGSTMEVFAQRPRDLRQVLTASADRFGDQTYLVFPGVEYTYRSILGPVASVAAALRDQYGVTKGDRVAIAGANGPEWAITFWAALSLGAVTAALNGWWTGPELSYGLELSQPRVLLGDRRRLERLDGRDVQVPTVCFEDSFDDLMSYDQNAAMPDVPLDEDDPFVILFTSGTTGRPKGAMISHRSNINFLQSSSLAGLARDAILAAENPGVPPTKPTDTPCSIAVSPMFHISGLNAQLILGAYAGMRLVYPPTGRWSEEAHLSLTEQWRATAWALVPTQLWRLLEWPSLDQYDLSSVTRIGGGGAVWPPELLRALNDRLPHIAPHLGIGFGMSETCGLGTQLRKPDIYIHPDSVGQPNPGVEVQIRGIETGEPVEPGETGEICMRTASLFLKYWNDPKATAESLGPDRWYRTGDHGRIHDGFLYLDGRRRDLIIRGGENIYPIEIENRLIEHPEVADAAVISVDHPTLGNEVKAVIVPRVPGAVSEADIQAWVGEALASFKVPTYVEFTDRLPRNASGKVVKHLLENPEQVADFVEDD